MTGWDRQINADGDTVSDSAVEALWEIVKELRDIADALRIDREETKE